MEKLAEMTVGKYFLQLVRFRKTYQIFFIVNGKITDVCTTTSKKRAYKMFRCLEGGIDEKNNI